MGRGWGGGWWRLGIDFSLSRSQSDEDLYLVYLVKRQVAVLLYLHYYIQYTPLGGHPIFMLVGMNTLQTQHTVQP